MKKFLFDLHYKEQSNKKQFTIFFFNQNKLHFYLVCTSNLFFEQNSIGIFLMFKPEETLSIGCFTHGAF